MTWIKKLLLCFFRLLPLKDDVILESHPDFSDNAGAVYQYLLKNGFNKRHRIYWLIRGTVPEELPQNVYAVPRESSSFSQEIKRLRILYGSRFILDSNSYIQKRRKGQVRFHLGHGMPIKYVPEYTCWEEIGECEAYLTLGKYWDTFYTEKAGLSSEILKPFGYPRNDILVKKRKEKISERFIIWMPTYRQHRNHRTQTDTKYPFGMPEIGDEKQLLRLNDVLGAQGLMLYFRPHPAQDLTVFQSRELSHVVIANDEYLKKRGVTLYELLGCSTALITDYSSVYFDYLLTGQPIGLTMGDREDFFRHNSSAFDNLEELGGYRIDSFDMLLEFVRFVCDFSETERVQYRNIMKKFHDNTDGNSSCKVIDFLRENYGFDK